MCPFPATPVPAAAQDAVKVEAAQPLCCATCGGTRLVYRDIESAETLRLATQDSS
jgi:hypothetical protein